MRRQHFERLKPICPNCQQNRGQIAPLVIRSTVREQQHDILEGTLICSDLECLSEFPIIDGIPLIMTGLRSYVAQNILPLMARRDLSESLESLFGDCCGPGSPYDTARQHLSIYGYGHYGDLDPGEESALGAGGILESIRRGLAMAGEVSGPIIDLGCAVGRSTCELAAAVEDLALGIDLNFGMLQMASRVIRRGIVRYPRRRVGIVYDRREFEVQIKQADKVDFWACDAAALPFAPDTFGVATGFNLLDCVGSPVDYLHEVARVLTSGAKAVLSAPYDWSATPMEAWLGGHSQRSEACGASEPVLRALLAGDHPQAIQGLKLFSEVDAIPWCVRLHDRSVMHYQSHLVVAQVE